MQAFVNKLNVIFAEIKLFDRTELFPQIFRQLGYLIIWTIYFVQQLLIAEILR